MTAGDGPGDGVAPRGTRGDIAALGDLRRALRHVSDDAILSARCDGLPRDGTVDLWMEEVRCDGPDALGFVWCEAVLRPDGEPPGPSAWRPSRLGRATRTGGTGFGRQTPKSGANSARILVRFLLNLT